MPATLEQGTLTVDEIRAELAGQFATEQYHRTTLFPWFVCTDGALRMAELCGAFWLLDVIASHVGTKRRLRAERFQLWVLRFLPEGAKNKASVTCATDSGPGGNVLAQQLIPHTDFPLPEGIELYCEYGAESPDGKPLWIVSLPSEH